MKENKPNQKNTFFGKICLQFLVIGMNSKTEQEILRTLQAINRTAVETDEVSAATAEVVNAQGEQIQRIAGNADKIEENLNTSEWLIRGLKGMKGRITNVFSGPSRDNSNTAGIAGSAIPASPAPNADKTFCATSSSFDNQMNDHLDQISSVLGNIHARSLELSHSISSQVKTVEAVDVSLARSHDRIAAQHRDIKKL